MGASFQYQRIWRSATVLTTMAVLVAMVFPAALWAQCVCCRGQQGSGLQHFGSEKVTVDCCRDKRERHPRQTCSAQTLNETVLPQRDSCQDLQPTHCCQACVAQTPPALLSQNQWSGELPTAMVVLPNSRPELVSVSSGMVAKLSQFHFVAPSLQSLYCVWRK